ncbi:hypothetical protein [Winogradskyella jejuensis]|nr:hypothetical protein [Winogradskyella jejuensis]
MIKKAVEGYSKFLGLSEIGLKNIAGYGWYIDGGITMGYTTQLMEKAVNGDNEFLDNFFVKYYRENINSLIEILKNRQDSRQKIIVEALDCHNEQKYYASTLLFLSQADGICNGQLYRTKKEKEALKKFLSKSENGNFINILLRMITDESAIDVGYSKKESFDSKLNRHAVVHGLDLNFGSEINSLKAFSLLCFVSDFVNRYKKL